MSRNERHLFVGVLLVLAAALAVMLVQNTPMSGQPAIRRVSVLLDGEDGAYWQNFRLGGDRAAREHSVDVRYITRYEGAAGAAQAELLRKEWEGELDGVILVPLDGAALSEALEEAPAGLAVAVAGPALPEVKNACSVSASTCSRRALRLAARSQRSAMFPSMSAVNSSRALSKATA